MTVAISDGHYAQRFTDIRKKHGKDFHASTLLTAASFALPEIMVRLPDSRGRASSARYSKV
jgi:hypothetical protein